MISIVAAMDEKRGIGKNNLLPWHIPEDLKRFHDLTTGHPVIMGRKTFESILSYKGKPLANRENIVLTRDPGFGFGGVTPVHNLEEAIGVSKSANEIFIIGGGQIFKEAMEKGLVDRLYLTIVKGDFHADIFFPDYSKFAKVIKKEIHTSGKFTFTFLDIWVKI